MTFVLYCNTLAIFEDCWDFLCSLAHVKVCFPCNWKASMFLHVACSGYHMYLQSLLLIVLFYLSKSLSNIFSSWSIIVREVFKSPIVIMYLSVFLYCYYIIDRVIYLYLFVLPQTNYTFLVWGSMFPPIYEILYFVLLLLYISHLECL